MALSDVTDTPRRDVVRYGVLYAILTVSVPAAVVSVDETAGAALLGVVVVAAVLVASWLTRTGDVGSPFPEIDTPYDVHVPYTDDARGRLRLLLWSLGVILVGVVALGLWANGVLPAE